jgi:hypothetical protein
MQELIPAVWDDAELHHNGKKVPASRSVSLGFQGQWFELDLTAEHAAALEQQTSYWTVVGRKISDAPKPPSPGATGTRSQMGESRKYNERMTKWAEAPEHKGRYKITRNEQGKPYYPMQLRKDYAAYLAEQAGAERGSVPAR